MKHFTIPIFVPELACPNRCVFCNQRSISGCRKQPEPEEVREIIMQHLKTIPEKDSHIEIGFFGGSFTGIEPELQEKYLEVAKEFLSHSTRWVSEVETFGSQQSNPGLPDEPDSGWSRLRSTTGSGESNPDTTTEAGTRWSRLRSTTLSSNRIHGIRLSTRPDYISDAVLERLKGYGVTTIELGAQSLDDEVLRLSGRGHTVADVEKASAMIRAAGFSLGLQMMTGLPGDTREKSLSTARKIIELGADCTRIYPTLVIRETELESLWKSGKYTPQTLEEAVRLTAELLNIFGESNVQVIRVGLHPSESLLEGGEMLAGPFHPSFRALAESDRWKRKLEQLTECNQKNDHIRIEVPEDQLSYAIGHNSSNKRWLQSLFSKVKFIPIRSRNNRKPLIVCDKRIPLPAKNILKRTGNCHFVETDNLVYKSISGHPDIFLCHSGRQVVVAPALFASLEACLTLAGFEVVRGQQNLGKTYPETARYNAVVTNEYIIHNLKISDPAIFDAFPGRRHLHVNQGYTRCNLLALGNDHFITSDRGIEKVLSGEGKQVLYADPAPVKLRGQKHGFLPGCCGIFQDQVLIAGSLEHHAQKTEIIAFIEMAGYSVLELLKGELTDVGGIFVFPGNKEIFPY